METDNRLFELHVIMSDDVNIAFHPPTLTLLKVGRQAAEILRDYEDGYSPIELAGMHNCALDDVASLLQTLKEHIENQPLATPIQVDPFSGDLTLLVSRDCNLRCVYCYAEGGSYKKDRLLMSEETAIQALDLFMNSAHGFQFRGVTFFGGEPTLNIPVVRKVCEYLKEAVEADRILHLPILAMVTNGTYFSDELCALVSEYDMQITVSLDGPPKINDLLRIDATGKGTFETVARTIRRLQQATNGREPRMIESTVTKKHLEQGFSYDDLTRFFIDTFGITQHHVVPVYDWTDCGLEMSENEATAWETAMFSEFVSELAAGSLQVSKLGRRAVSILNKKKFNPYLCIAGVASLTIDADGAIYPCYQLNNEKCYMGHVSDPQMLDSDRVKEMQGLFMLNSKIQHPQCRTCWLRHLCTGCFGGIYLRTGSPFGRVDSICTRRKISASRLLLELVRLRTDKIKWQQAIKTVKEALSLEAESMF